MDALAIIARLGQGHLLEELADALQRTAEDCVETGQKGTVTRARWAREQGYVEVANLASGETVEIPVRQCTPVWKRDLDEIRKQRM